MSHVCANHVFHPYRAGFLYWYIIRFKVNIVLSVRYVIQSLLCFSRLARGQFAD